MKLNIWDDYDRRNPVTMEEALENWMDEADKDETQNKGYDLFKLLILANWFKNSWLVKNKMQLLKKIKRKLSKNN